MAEVDERRLRTEALPCAVLVDGPLGSGVLIPGVTYKVVEVRERWEPTGRVGEPPLISTVIRFDPADFVRRGIEQEIAVRVVAAIERVLSDQALNTPLNREALISVVRSAAEGADHAD